MKHSFLISAPTSGSGKTTIARGLMALLVKKGMRVQPFKCGSDYIDIKFHAAVCGRPSINLDTFMASREHVKELFVHYGADADVCIVEGMMGLFDGYDRDKGSSAEIASVLNVPVVLVVDAKSAAYSMAALLHGFLHFTPTFSQPSTPNPQLPTVNCQLSTLNSQLSTVNSQLSTLNCQLSTSLVSFSTKWVLSDIGRCFNRCATTCKWSVSDSFPSIQNWNRVHAIWGLTFQKRRRMRPW